MPKESDEKARKDTAERERAVKQLGVVRDLVKEGVRQYILQAHLKEGERLENHASDSKTLQENVRLEYSKELGWTVRIVLKPLMKYFIDEKEVRPPMHIPSGAHSELKEKIEEYIAVRGKHSQLSLPILPVDWQNPPDELVVGLGQ